MISEAEREKRRERALALHAAGKFQRKKKEPQPPGEVVAPEAAVPEQAILIKVDWEGIELTEAQNLYSKLRAVLEAAGQIIQRRLSIPTIYQCANPKGCARTMTARDAKGVDLERRDPKTGLYDPAYLCSEICWNEYMRDRLERKHKERERLRQEQGR